MGGRAVASRRLALRRFLKMPILLILLPPLWGRGHVKLCPLRRRSRGERGAVKLAPLRRRSRGERSGWGGRRGACTRALRRPFTPTLALPHQGGGNRKGKIFARNRLRSMLASPDVALPVDIDAPRACYVLWMSTDSARSSSGHSRTRGNPGGPPDLASRRAPG